MVRSTVLNDATPAPNPRNIVTTAAQKAAQAANQYGYNNILQAPAPAPTPAPAPAPAPAPVSGGGAVRNAGTTVPAVALQPFDLNNQFGYQQELKNEANALQDYDAQSTYGQQTTQADQSVKRAALQDQLNKLGQNNAEDFASRGLGSSGLVFKAQDNIDKQGVTAGNQIDQLLTQFLGQRQQGRQSLQQQQAAALAQVAQQLTQQYASGALQTV